MTIKLGQFRNRQLPEVSFDEWVFHEAVDMGALGSFELLINLEKGEKPDDVMLRCASDLRHVAPTLVESVIDLLFADYRAMVRNDPAWMRRCGVGVSLTREQVVHELLPERWLVVNSVGFEPGSSSVHVIPRWDEEHAFDAEIRDGVIVNVNGRPR